jgi:homopolymeric O-antigen transport system permease protein
MNDTLSKATDSVEAKERAPAVQHEAFELPETPVVRIRPSGRWAALNLRDLWAYRELFYFLIWRDLKVRYKQTLLGVAWVIIQPLLSMLVFALIFGRVVGVPSEGIPYPLFAMAGLLPWTFFSSSVTRSGNSLVGSAHLITKVYFPRLLIPSAAVAACLVDFAIGFAMLALLMVYYGVPVSMNLLMLPMLVLLTALFALGIGLWASALNVKYRDVGQILPFMVLLGMFATPIIYPSSIFPAKWLWVLELNPLTGIIEGYRASLFRRSFDWSAIGISAAVTLGLLVCAAYSFRSMEKDFADVV